MKSKTQTKKIEFPEVIKLHPGLRPLLKACKKSHISDEPPATNVADALERIRGSLWHIDIADGGSANGDNRYLCYISPDGLHESYEVWIGEASDSEGGMNEAIMRAYRSWRNSSSPIYTEKALAAISRHLLKLCNCKEDFNKDDPYAEGRGYATWNWDCISDMDFVDRLGHFLESRSKNKEEK